MKSERNYIDINKESWNKRIHSHLKSDFYKRGWIFKRHLTGASGRCEREKYFTLTMSLWTGQHFFGKIWCEYNRS